jgi:hypothetical protein
MDAATPAFAYLTDDRIHVVDGEEPRSFKSQFAEEVIDRALRLGRKNAWKTQGSGARFLFGNMPSPEEQAVTPVHLSGLASAEGRLIYSLDTEAVSALLALDPESGDEKRLFHSNESRLDSFSPAADGKSVACSVRNTHGVLDLGLLDLERGGMQELTEGDSADSHPAWRLDHPNRLVYQSCGLARDEDGWVVDRGPSSIECLDFDHGSLETLAEDAKSDLLTPRVDTEGRLYYIRRPYKRSRGPGALGMLKAILLFPFHFVLAIFHLVNSMTAAFSRKPLMDTGTPRRDERKVERMQILGELVEVGKNRSRRHRSTDDDAGLVPDSWQLVRIADADGADADGADAGRDPEVLAKGVLAFDLLKDGSVLYSNGSAIYHLAADGKKQRLAKDRHIRRVVAL